MTTTVRWSRTTTLDDAGLAGRHLEGDPQAFGALVDRYQARLSTFVTRATGDRERAEDLVQEIFIRVFRHLHRFDRTRKFSAWVYAIALNVTNSELRRRHLTAADCVRLEAASPGSSSRW